MKTYLELHPALCSLLDQQILGWMWLENLPSSNLSVSCWFGDFQSTSANYIFLYIYHIHLRFKNKQATIVCVENRNDCTYVECMGTVLLRHVVVLASDNCKHDHSTHSCHIVLQCCVLMYVLQVMDLVD